MVFTGAAVTTPAKCGCLLIHYSPIIPRVESQIFNLRKMYLTFANMLNLILSTSVHHATGTDVKFKKKKNSPMFCVLAAKYHRGYVSGPCSLTISRSL